MTHFRLMQLTTTMNKRVHEVATIIIVQIGTPMAMATTITADCPSKQCTCETIILNGLAILTFFIDSNCDFT